MRRQRPGKQHACVPIEGSSCIRIVELTTFPRQSESVLIQKLFTHFKKTPGTHKLGVLYVVDSVTRKWLDQAKAHGQTPSLTAPDGTFAAGVYRVTELIPILMNDIIATAPEDQKVRKDRTECHLISITQHHVRRAHKNPQSDCGRRSYVGKDFGTLLRARLACALRTHTSFFALMLDAHSQGWYS
jgi:hypothetical protein